MDEVVVLQLSLELSLSVMPPGDRDGFCTPRYPGSMGSLESRGPEAARPWTQHWRAALMFPMHYLFQTKILGMLSLEGHGSLEGPRWPIGPGWTLLPPKESTRVTATGE